MTDHEGLPTDQDSPNDIRRNRLTEWREKHPDLVSYHLRRLAEPLMHVYVWLNTKEEAPSSRSHDDDESSHETGADFPDATTDESATTTSAEGVGAEAIFTPPPPEPESIGDDESIIDDTEAILPPDIALKARGQQLPANAVKKAMDAGFEDPVGFLVKIRANESTKRRWETLLGIDLSPELELDDTRAVENAEALDDDPYWRLNRRGQSHGEEVAQITQDVGTARRKAKKRLKRVTPPIPGIRHIRRNQLASRMYQYHVANRPEENERTKEKILYDDTFFGRRKKKKAFKKRISALDSAIASERGKLNLVSHHELLDLKTDRQRIAENILMLEQLRQAVLEGKTIPDDFYNHASFEQWVKDAKKEAKEETDKLVRTG